MPKTEFVVAAGPEAGSRLDVFLSTRIPGTTRSALQKQIDAGKVTVGGIVRKSSHKLKADERVEIEIAPPEEHAGALKPQAIPLKIIYADADVIVIDKPSGLVTHPGAGNSEGTLANALIAMFPEVAAVGPEERPGIVHRLDKGTSGVIIAARTPAAFATLIGQFKRHEVQKTYIGLVHGRVGAAEGRINWPIGRHVTQGNRISTHTKNPRDAETDFRVVERFAETTLLEVRPLTGRTHQIRVHLAAAGHPIVGDSLYGRRKTNRKYPRLFLHARSISFLHPATGERVEFDAPLPAELEAVLAVERRRSA